VWDSFKTRFETILDLSQNKHHIYERNILTWWSIFEPMFIKSFSCSFMDAIRSRLYLYCDTLYTHASFISISKIETLDRQTREREREREREIFLKTRKIIKIYFFFLLCVIQYLTERMGIDIVPYYEIEIYCECETHSSRMLFTGEIQRKYCMYPDFFMLQSRFARNISLRVDLIFFEPKLEIVAFLWKSFMMPSISPDNSRRYTAPGAASTIIYDSNWACESAWKSSSSRDPAQEDRPWHFLPTEWHRVHKPWSTSMTTVVGVQ